jgi:hypothetical protein
MSEEEIARIEYQPEPQPRVPAEVGPVEERSLLAALASDAHNIATNVLGGVGTALVINKMKGGGGSPPPSTGQDGGPPKAG